MAAVILPVVEPAEDAVSVQTRIRPASPLNFEFFDQLECLGLRDVPHYISEELEGAD